MNSKKSYKKGFTLIELVVTASISLILFSILSNVIFQTVNSTRKIAKSEDMIQELYFFESFLRDEIGSAKKIYRDGTHGFKIQLDDKGEKIFHYYLNNYRVQRSAGHNTLISGVKKYEQELNEDEGYIKIDILMQDERKSEIIIQTRAEIVK